MSQLVTVTATNDDLTGDRSGTLTLTATGYAVETVTVMILDNPSVVGVTTLENEASTTISEADGNVTLQLNINLPFNSESEVNILYSGDPGALTGDFSSVIPANTPTPTVVMVPSNVTEHTFDVEVMNDEIAEFIRQVDVSVADGLAYQATSSSVKITVEDNDVATVSISRVEDTVTEGEPITFTVTQDRAIDQANSISLTLTHNGDFFSPRMDTLNLTSDEGLNLNLTGRHKRNGKLYYYLDLNSNSDPDDNDRINA